jgi:two-component system copper resistance phosphate regulon response regulator CusR
MMHILLVEDEAKLAQSIAATLEEADYTVTIAYDGIIAEKLFQQQVPDFVILDINVPGKNGLALCADFRKKNPTLPILMLTALGEVEDKMEAFEAGADDYLVKPFHIRELIARIQAITKRMGNDTGVKKQLLVAGNLEMDTTTKEVRRAGKLVKLSHKEYLLLETLLNARGRVLSKAELAEKVWELDFDTGTNSVEVYINFLRGKIDKPYPDKLIHTRSGFGYYLKDESA